MATTIALTIAALVLLILAGSSYAMERTRDDRVVTGGLALLAMIALAALAGWTMTQLWTDVPPWNPWGYPTKKLNMDRPSAASRWVSSAPPPCCGGRNGRSTLTMTRSA